MLGLNKDRRHPRSQEFVRDWPCNDTRISEHVDGDLRRSGPDLFWSEHDENVEAAG